MNSELYANYLAQHVNKPLDDCTLVALTGAEAVEALWAFNDRFSPHSHRIASLPYEARFEAEADAALVSYVFDNDDWATLSAQAWRVLLERQQQSIILFQLHATEALIPVPQELSPQYRLGAVLLYAIHERSLPFPLLDKEALAVSSGTLVIPLRQQ